MTCRVCLDRGRVQVLPAGEQHPGHSMWMDCPACTTPTEVTLLEYELRKTRQFTYLFGFTAIAEGLLLLAVVWL